MSLKSILGAAITLRSFILLMLVLPVLAFAGVDVVAGEYRVKLTTQPKVIPVGQAKVVLKITDAAGKPLDGLDVRAIAKMPGMNMGEREARAAKVSGEPGSYAMQTPFPMGGAYEVTVKIDGPHGASTAVIRVSTGQDTSEAGGGGVSLVALVPWAIGIALVLFVIYRMRKTGQGMNWKGVFNRSTVGGTLLLAILLAISVYTVNNLRRSGSMTPIEAQVMEMNTPAPAGTTAVQLATVTRGPISETVRYTGQAIGYVEQDVIPRGTGVITWMPFYVGDKVKKGQVVAQLDTSQLDPQLAEKAAMSNMAVQGVDVAATEYRQALAEVAQAEAELAIREGAVDEAKANVSVAEQERESVTAELAAAKTGVTEAEAQLTAAEADAKYWAEELERTRTLFQKGAVSKQELQQTEAQAAGSRSKVRQSQAAVAKEEANVRAAEARLRKSGSAVVAAQKRVKQATAELMAHHAHVRSARAAAEAAKKKIGQAQSGVAQARAGYQGAAAQKGYASIKAEVDGVITQRLISPGVLVNPGQSILKIAQISPIRLQANVAASDIGRIRVGSNVTVTSREGVGVPIQAQVTSISPSVDSQARTGSVEVVWPNSNARFLPGQFVEMRIEVDNVRNALSVPVEAIQHPPGAPGEAKPFVWVAEPGPDAGRFTARRVEVRLGASDGKRVAVSGDLKDGLQVVTTGAAYLREGGEVAAPVAEIKAKGPVVEIVASGYKPDTVQVEVGKPVTITFIRRTDQTCGTEIILPDLNINKSLPLNKPIEVTLTPTKTGELRFTCGMDMLRGKVVVR